MFGEIAYLEENCVWLSFPKEIGKLVGFCEATAREETATSMSCIRTSTVNLHGPSFGTRSGSYAKVNILLCLKLRDNSESWLEKIIHITIGSQRPQVCENMLQDYI